MSDIEQRLQWLDADTNAIADMKRDECSAAVQTLLFRLSEHIRFIYQKLKGD